MSVDVAGRVVVKAAPTESKTLSRPESIVKKNNKTYWNFFQVCFYIEQQNIFSARYLLNIIFNILPTILNLFFFFFFLQKKLNKNN